MRTEIQGKKGSLNVGTVKPTDDAQNQVKKTFKSQKSIKGEKSLKIIDNNQQGQDIEEQDVVSIVFD